MGLIYEPVGVINNFDGNSENLRFKICVPTGGAVLSTQMLACLKSV